MVSIRQFLNLVWILEGEKYIPRKLYALSLSRILNSNPCLETGVRLWRGSNRVSLTHKTDLVTKDTETINYSS